MLMLANQHETRLTRYPRHLELDAQTFADERVLQALEALFINGGKIAIIPRSSSEFPFDGKLIVHYSRPARLVDTDADDTPSA